jgi:hypothetical protein
VLPGADPRDRSSGAIGYNQVSKSGAEGGGKGMAIAGIVCGVIGCFICGHVIPELMR